MGRATGEGDAQQLHAQQLHARACNVNVCKYKEVDLTKLIYIKMASLPLMNSALKMASSQPSRAVPKWRSRSGDGGRVNVNELNQSK